ncbi:MAG: alpha/beta fold hydrolase [Terriglobales bacterium]
MTACRSLRSLRSLARIGAFALAFTVASLAQAHPAFSVRISGHGPAMIFIPGMNSSAATWDSTVAQLKDHYTCYVLQLAGFAGAAPIEQPLLPAVKTELLAYVRGHHLDHPILVGHSLGGVIALDVVEAAPSRFGPVVIVDSLPFYAGTMPGVNNLAAAQPMIAQMKAGMAHMTKAAYVKAAEAGVYTNSMTTSPAHQALLKQWSSSSDLDTFRNATIEMYSLDLCPGLRNIQQPVLVLGTWRGWQKSFAAGGIHLTRTDFVAEFQKQYASLAHLHFAMADHSRHFIMWDDPAWFFGQLDAFLAHPEQSVQSRGF